MPINEFDLDGNSAAEIVNDLYQKRIDRHARHYDELRLQTMFADYIKNMQCQDSSGNALFDHWAEVLIDDPVIFEGVKNAILMESDAGKMKSAQLLGLLIIGKLRESLKKAMMNDI